MRAAMLALVLSSLVATIACTRNEKPPQLQVTSREWSITPTSSALAPGRTEFVLTNEGSRPHELVVVKTDLPPSQLPLESGKADEDRLHVVGRVPVVSAGATGRASMVVSPGKYLLICNLVEQGTAGSHLSQGMATSITVSD